jgi:hypothetical protein
VKKIFVFGSGLDAALIAELLRSRGICEAYGITISSQTDPPPTILEMVHLSDVPAEKSVPKPDARTMPDKSVRMRAKSR